MSLTHVNISETGITDLKPLAGLPLYRLEAADTGVAELGQLSAKIGYLNLSGTGVKDLRPIATAFGNRPKRIDILNLANTPVSDLKPLFQIPIGELNLSGTRVTDLSPLSKSILSSIVLDDMKELKDLEPLERCTGLSNVSLARSSVNDKEIERFRSKTYGQVFVYE